MKKLLLLFIFAVFCLDIFCQPVLDLGGDVFTYPIPEGYFIDSSSTGQTKAGNLQLNSQLRLANDSNYIFNANNRIYIVQNNDTVGWFDGGDFNVNKLYIHTASDWSSPTSALTIDGNSLVKSTTIVEDPVNFLDSFSIGTVYQLTATPALLDFGTNDPSLIINEAGVYRLYYNVILQYNAATFAANRTITIKIRRTNNTPADIVNSTKTTITRIITTISDHACSISGYVSYSTANDDDILQIWGDVSVVPSAGSLDCIHAQISADRIY